MKNDDDKTLNMNDYKKNLDIDKINVSNLYRGNDVIDYTKDKYDPKKTNKNEDNKTNVNNNEDEDSDKNETKGNIIASIVKFSIVYFIIQSLILAFLGGIDFIFSDLALGIVFITTIIAIPFIIMFNIIKNETLKTFIYILISLIIFHFIMFII